MRRLIALLLLVSVGCIFFIGCTNTRREPYKTPDLKKRVALLHYFSGTLTGGLQEMVDSFNQQTKNYELVATSIDHEAFKTSISSTLASPRSPDLYSYWAGARVQAMLEHLEPFDEVWMATHLAANVPPSVSAACTYNGKIYLLPITQHYIAFFYNKKLFSQVGIEPPTTWAEFLTLCDKLKAAGKTPIALGAREKWPTQFWFDYLLLRTAGYDYRQRLMEGKASYGDAPVRRVFDLWTKLVKKQYFNANPSQSSWDTDASEAVFTGEAGMTLMGTWITSYYADENHHWKAGEDYDYFAFPIVDEGVPSYALGPIDGLVLSKNAMQKPGAKEVLTHLASVDSLKIMSRGSGAFVPHVGVEKEFYSPMQQRMLKDIQQTPQWAFNYDLATPPTIATLGLNLFNEILEFPEQQDTIINETIPKIEKHWKFISQE